MPNKYQLPYEIEVSQGDQIRLIGARTKLEIGKIALQSHTETRGIIFPLFKVTNDKAERIGNIIVGQIIDSSAFTDYSSPSLEDYQYGLSAPAFTHRDDYFSMAVCAMGRQHEVHSRRDMVVCPVHGIWPLNYRM